MSGVVLFACMVSFWIYCALSRVLNPGSILGTFAGNLMGVIMIAIGSAIFAGVASTILAKLGYPIVKQPSQQD